MYFALRRFLPLKDLPQFLGGPEGSAPPLLDIFRNTDQHVIVLPVINPNDKTVHLQSLPGRKKPAGII